MGKKKLFPHWCFISKRPRAALSVMVSCSASPKQQLLSVFFCFFFCSQSGAKTFARSLKARSLLPCLRATTCRKNCLPFTDSWHLNFKTCVRAAEPLVLILPLKVRKKEKGARNSLCRVQFLQRNEESSHCVSWKPGRMPKEREKGTERGHG